MAKWRSLVAGLESDDEFKKLDYKTQQIVRNEVLTNKLAIADKQFAMLDSATQNLVVRKMTKEAPPAFKDPRLQRMAEDIYANPVLGKANATVGSMLRGMMDQSGIGQGVTYIMSALAGVPDTGDSTIWERVYGDDAKKLKEYMLDVSPLGDIWYFLGSALGFFIDVVGITKATAPARAAATAAGETAFKAGRLGPFMARTVLPNAADSVAGAIPWFLRSELNNLASGEETALSKDAWEVAKGLGLGAATDFLVGAAITSLGTLTTGVKMTFMRGRLDKALHESEKITDTAIRAIDNGNIPEEVMAGFSPWQQATVKQRMRLRDYFARGLEDRRYRPIDRTYHAANDLGSTLEELPDASWKLYEVGDRDVTETVFRTLDDVQDHLAIKLNAIAEKNALSKKAVKQGYAESIENAHGWLTQRAKTIEEAQSFYKHGAENIEAVKESGLVRGTAELKRYGKMYSSPDRIVMTQMEADSVLKNAANGEVIQARIPIVDETVRRANEGRKLFNVENAINAVPDTKGNAIVYLGKVADQDVYNAALKDGMKITANGGLMTPKQIASMRLVEEGYSAVRKVDGSFDVINPYGIKLIGSVDAARVDLFKTPKLSAISKKLPGALRKAGTWEDVPYDVKKHVASKMGTASVDNTMLRSAVPEDLAKTALEQSPHKVIKVGDAIEVTTETGTKKVYNTYQEAIDDLDIVPAKIDSRYAPQDNTIVSQESVAVKDGVLSGTEADVKAVYGSFEDTQALLTKRLFANNTNGAIYTLPSGMYEVTVPRMGIRHTFETPREAREFLEGGYKKVAAIKSSAAKKGLSASVKNGDWVLTDGRKTYTARTIDELEALFRKFPDGDDGAPSIFAALDPHIDQEVESIVKTYKAANVLARPLNFNSPLSLWRNLPQHEESVASAIKTVRGFQAHTAATVPYLEAIANDINDPYLAQTVRRLKTQYQLVDRDITRTSSVITSVFANESGTKIIAKDRRQAIYYWMQMQDAAKKAKPGSALAEALSVKEEEFAKKFGKLSTHEERIVEKIDDVMEQLGTKFGIKSYSLLFDYLPRLKEYAETGNAAADLSDAMDFVKSFSASSNIPHDVKFWAENMRTQDLLDIATVDDALEAMILYANQGTKKYYLNPVWREFDAYLQKNQKLFPEYLGVYFNNVRERMMGVYQTDAEKQIASALGNAFSRLAGKDLSGAEMNKVGRNMFSSLIRLNVFTNMAWRPWAAVRNSMQIIQTLGSRFGFTNMARAVKGVAENPEAVYKELLDNGIITGLSPNINDMQAGKMFWKFFGHEVPIDTLYEGGMKWFRNADEYTRAVAYKQGQLMFDDAITMLNNGRIDIDGFAHASGISLINPQLRDHLVRLVKAGDALSVKTARYEFANILQQDTMFGFHAWEAPAMFKGVIGKLFGQFGSYSAAFRSNIFNAVKYGTGKQKALFAARYLGANAAVWSGLAAIGINAPDFIPFSPMFFTGGPMFDLAMDSLKATDPGWEGDQARQKLRVNAPRMIPVVGPLGYQLKKSIDLQSVHGYASWLALTGTPIRNEMFSSSSQFWDMDKGPFKDFVK